MKKFIKYKILKPIVAFFQSVINALLYPKISDAELLKNFDRVKSSYSRILNNFGHSVRPNDRADGYYWEDWILKISTSFSQKVSIRFFRQPEISLTMVFTHINGFLAANRRINYIKRIFSDETMINLLKEDQIGGPNIVSFSYLTSANRAHHTFHLARYKEMTGKNFWDTGSVVEFGGGYGNMARLIVKMNPSVTYTVLDLPELLSLQYVYLASIFGEEKLNCVFNKEHKMIEGKINLVPSNLVINNDVIISADSFISTWAVTEAPKHFQDDVFTKNFLGAQNILMGSLQDANNHLKSKIDNNFKIEEVQFLPIGHEYWVK